MLIPLRNLWWMTLGAGYGARYMRLRWKAIRAPRKLSLHDPTEELLRLQGLYGYNAHSLVSIMPGRVYGLRPLSRARLFTASSVAYG